jgi:hypothetical protein
MCARHQEFKNSSSSIKGKTNVQQEDEVASAHLDKKRCEQQDVDLPMNFSPAKDNLFPKDEPGPELGMCSKASSCICSVIYTYLDSLM